MCLFPHDNSDQRQTGLTTGPGSKRKQMRQLWSCGTHELYRNISSVPAATKLHNNSHSLTPGDQDLRLNGDEWELMRHRWYRSRTRIADNWKSGFDSVMIPSLQYDETRTSFYFWSILALIWEENNRNHLQHPQSGRYKVRFAIDTDELVSGELFHWFQWQICSCFLQQYFYNNIFYHNIFYHNINVIETRSLIQKWKYYSAWCLTFSHMSWLFRLAYLDCW